jgi:acyl carrier protein
MDMRERVRQFITSNFYVRDPIALSDDASLLDNGIIDSTGVLELISFIEDNFGVSVETVDMVPENLDSIARIGAYVARRLA